MQYTERAPDNVIDALHNAPCFECGGIGEIDYLADGYRGRTANNPYADTATCPACGGAGFQMEVWERVE